MLSHKANTAISYASSLVSIYGVCTTYEKGTVFFWMWLIVLIAAFIAFCIYLLKKNCDRIECKSGEMINQEMKRIITTGDRLLILTRDLSWAKSNNDVWESLVTKAKTNSLHIHMQHPNGLARELQDYGADIKYYGELGFTPRVRFTIMHYGTPYAKVAIGYKNKDDVHIIEYSRLEASSPLHLAEDISILLGKINERSPT